METTNKGNPAMSVARDPNEERDIEHTAVMLAEIKGIVNGVSKDVTNVLEKVVDLRSDVKQHGIHIANLQSDMQQVKSDASAAARALQDADRGREALAKALKDADEKRVADAKAIVDQGAAKWSASPWMKMYIALGGLASIVLIWFYISHPHG